MSAPAPTAPRTLDYSGTPGVSFLNLIRVELRKMMDTRSGFWLLLLTGLMLFGLMALMLLVTAVDDHLTLTANAWAQSMVLPVSILVPLFAVLTITTEWSQRTNLVTFTLEPRRLRVLVAKLAAVTLLAVLTIVAAVAFGALGNVLYGAISGHEVVWNVGADDVFKLAVSQLLFFLMGFGLAMLLLSTPGSIAVYYVVGLLLPLMVYTSLMAFFDWARDLIPWIDLTTGTSPIFTGANMMGEPVDLGATEWAQAGVATLIWVVLPLVLGAWRVLRTEVK